MPNVAIVWDFDGTLTPDDSTTQTVEVLDEGQLGKFWAKIKSLRGDKKRPKWEHVLASDAPVWMYSLSRLAFDKKVPLNSEFFRKFVLPKIKLYPRVLPFLQKLKALSKERRFRAVDLSVHHFVVSAGLKDLIEQAFPKGLVTWTFGCRYTVTAVKGHKDEPESIPVFCMDETVKTRSLFEISKGSFNNPKRQVNSKVEANRLWAPFENIVYVGDGDTDIPALSLVRAKGGAGIAVFNPEADRQRIERKLKQLRLGKRADLIAPASFSLSGQLYTYLEQRCIHILQRYEAQQLS